MIEWDWGYVGRCYVDGYLSHEVHLRQYSDGTFGGNYFGLNEDVGMGATLLGCLEKSSNISEAITIAEIEAERVKINNCPNLKALRKKMEEYPYEKRKSK